MYLKDRISPILPTRTLSFLLGLLTPILSLRFVNLLGQFREERHKTEWQEAQGPPRHYRGQLPLLHRNDHTRLKVWLSGWAALSPLSGRGRNVCKLPLSIFAWPGLLGSNLWPLHMCLLHTVRLAARWISNITMARVISRPLIWQWFS